MWRGINGIDGVSKWERGKWAVIGRGAWPFSFRSRILAVARSGTVPVGLVAVGLEAGV